MISRYIHFLMNKETTKNTADIQLAPPDVLVMASECLRVMSHPVRLRIVEVLMQAELPVGRVADICELAPNQTTEHLRLMKSHGLLSSRRQGRNVYYSIADPRLPSLLKCVKSNCNIQ